MNSMLIGYGNYLTKANYTNELNKLFSFLSVFCS